MTVIYDKVAKKNPQTKEYRIRKLRISEIRLLRTFLYEAIYQPSYRDKLPVSVIDTPELYLYIDNWGKANDHCLVLEIENIIVGAIWVRILKNGYGHIYDTIPELCMSLLKDFRNQGFGTLLIKKMIDDMKLLGYKHISLSVSKDNYAADWYRKLGFKIYKEQKEDYIMVVDLY